MQAIYFNIYVDNVDILELKNTDPKDPIEQETEKAFPDYPLQTRQDIALLTK